MTAYKTIFRDMVRLHRNGRVQYWDGPLCCWRDGWGPYATIAALGDDGRMLDAWRQRDQAGEPNNLPQIPSLPS